MPTKKKVYKTKWSEFTGTLPLLSEKQLKRALDDELKSAKPRKEYIMRMHRKYNQLRYAREQREYGIVT